MSMMNKEERDVKTIIDEVEGFKNTTVNFNEEKKICDIYTKCLLPEDEFLEKMKTLKKVTVVKCDFGIFEMMFPTKNLDKQLKSFTELFNK